MSGSSRSKWANARTHSSKFNNYLAGSWTASTNFGTPDRINHSITIVSPLVDDFSRNDQFV